MTVTDVYDALIEAVATAVTDLENLGIDSNKARVVVKRYVSEVVDTFEDDDE